MRHNKKIKVEKEQLVMVECNKCGKMHYTEEANLNENLFHQFEVKFGYPSDHDEDIMTFDLCEDCLLTFTETFRTKAEIISYNPYGGGWNIG